MLKYYINLVHFPRYFATGNACKSRFLLIFHFCFQRFCTEYRKDRSSGQSYAFCTLLTCCSWWSATNWFLMPIWTTLRSMGFADPQILLTSARQCPCVPMRFRLGWRPIDCSWTTRRLTMIRQWLGDRDCTAQYNCCLPATTDCRRFCCFVFLFFSFFLSF